MRLRHALYTFLVLATAAAVPAPLAIHAQEAPPVFRAGVSLVPITALVRDSRNRIVRNLNRDDFQVLEKGQPRPIVDFGAKDDAPITVAFLFDTSGSMGVSANLEKGKDVVEDFAAAIDDRVDQLALFTFDRALRQRVAFTSDREDIYDALDDVKPWGLTSLYDAIAQTAKQLADQPSQRRAVVVITDGVDTSSALTPAEVSGLASSIDVPVYVVAVVSPLDHPGTATAVVPEHGDASLVNLARWTGGELFHVSAGDQTLPMTRELLASMRHQYFLAIESSAAPGWYQLEVKTKRQGLTVRARTGYFAAEAPRISAVAPVERSTRN